MTQRNSQPERIDALLAEFRRLRAQGEALDDLERRLNFLRRELAYIASELTGDLSRVEAANASDRRFREVLRGDFSI